MRTSLDASWRWKEAWQVTLSTPCHSSDAPHAAETDVRAETADAERRVISQCESLAHEVVSVSVEEAKQSLGEHKLQVEQQAAELHQLQEDLEKGHGSLRNEVGEQC